MTKIEWCDETINPIIGCNKISPACDHCYAEIMANRLTCQKFNLPLSAIIGAVDIEDCIPIERSHNGINLLCLFYKGNNMGFLSEKEMAFGDYRNGRFAWIGKNHRVLVDPISYKNGQGYYQNFKGDESKLMFK
jgi:hypothetical protein